MTDDEKTVDMLEEWIDDKDVDDEELELERVPRCGKRRILPIDRLR